MTWEEYVLKKDWDAFKRLFTEMLVGVFNNILNMKYYQYHMVKWLTEEDKKSKKKLDQHNESIDWLLNPSEMKDLCFSVLELEHINQERILKAISRKFNGNRKFTKFFTDYARETETGNLNKYSVSVARKELLRDTKSKNTSTNK